MTRACGQMEEALAGANNLNIQSSITFGSACQEHFDPRNVQEREKLHVVYHMLPFSSLIHVH